jgi:hypothetical protein
MNLQPFKAMRNIDEMVTTVRWYPGKIRTPARNRRSGVAKAAARVIGG